MTLVLQGSVSPSGAWGPLDSGDPKLREQKRAVGGRGPAGEGLRCRWESRPWRRGPGPRLPHTSFWGRPHEIPRVGPPVGPAQEGQERLVNLHGCQLNHRCGVRQPLVSTSWVGHGCHQAGAAGGASVWGLPARPFCPGPSGLCLQAWGSETRPGSRGYGVSDWSQCLAQPDHQGILPPV